MLAQSAKAHPCVSGLRRPHCTALRRSSLSIDLHDGYRRTTSQARESWQPPPAEGRGFPTSAHSIHPHVSQKVASMLEGHRIRPDLFYFSLCAHVIYFWPTSWISLKQLMFLFRARSIIVELAYWLLRFCNQKFWTACQQYHFQKLENYE